MLCQKQHKYLLWFWLSYSLIYVIKKLNPIDKTDFKKMKLNIKYLIVCVTCDPTIWHILHLVHLKYPQVSLKKSERGNFLWKFGFLLLRSRRFLSKVSPTFLPEVFDSVTFQHNLSEGAISRNCFLDLLIYYSTWLFWYISSALLCQRKSQTQSFVSSMGIVACTCGMNCIATNCDMRC